MKLRRWSPVIACVLLAASFFVWMLYGYTSPLALKFAGTYAAGSGCDQITFAVNPSERAFFYADQRNETYIRGEYEASGDHDYLLFYQDSDLQRAIPSQTITCKDTAIYVTINGREVLLEKISDAPIILSDTDRYS